MFIDFNIIMTIYAVVNAENKNMNPKGHFNLMSV